MTKVQMKNLELMDLLKLVNFRARKLNSVLSVPEVVEKLKFNPRMSYTIQDLHSMLDNLIYVSRKEQNNG